MPPPQITPERINQFAWGYIPPLVLEVAIRHRVFDVLDSGPLSLHQVHQQTGASERGLRAIMNVLVGLRLPRKRPERRLLPDARKRGLPGQHQARLPGRAPPPHQQAAHSQMASSQRKSSAPARPAAAVNQEGPGSTFFREFVNDIFPMSYPAANALAASRTLRRHRSRYAFSIGGLSPGCGASYSRRPPRRFGSLPWTGPT